MRRYARHPRTGIFIFAFLILFSLFIPPGFAQDPLFLDTFDIMGEWNIAHGPWVVKDGALVQTDFLDYMTHISRMVKQDGVMEYEFECSYIRGLEDRYGGFGIHICIDTPTSSGTWGMNNSYLFWITYDPRAYKRSDCFFLQVYRSISPTYMTFLHYEKGDKYPLDPAVLSPEDFIATKENGEKLKFRIQVNCENGQGRFYDPRTPGYYYPFDLKTKINPGMYISLRTNSISIGIDYVQVRKIE